ncbi:Uncharacterised protein [Klebsiella pneumoniae]|nr:Uncharacterised protein [Klebsiella pneumoniae]
MEIEEKGRWIFDRQLSARLSPFELFRFRIRGEVEKCFRTIDQTHTVTNRQLNGVVIRFGIICRRNRHHVKIVHGFPVGRRINVSVRKQTNRILLFPFKAEQRRRGHKRGRFSCRRFNPGFNQIGNIIFIFYLRGDFTCAFFIQIAGGSHYNTGMGNTAEE